MTDFWKNKKVIAYIALTHHTRFITPVMEELAKQGAKVLYIVGQAERSQEITSIKLGLNWAHVFDFVTDKDNDDIQRNYLLLRDAFKNNLKHNFLFGTSPVTVIDKTIYSTAVEYIGFRNLLKKEKPDLCFALHELNRWGKMFSFWSKKFKIPVITFQEGLYYGLDFGYTGHVQNSTLNLVWGERIKKKLTDFEAPGDKIIPVGNTHLSSEIKFQGKNCIREKKRKQYQCSDSFAILLLFSGEIPLIEELNPLFESIANSPDKSLFIKFHPITNQDQIKNWVSSIPDDCKTKVKTFHDQENTYSLMSLSDICVIVQPSTTGLEALAFGKPLIHLDVKMREILPYSFVEFKVAVKMTPAELSRAISENQDFSQLTRKEDLKNYFKNELSETADAIDIVTRISKKIISANQAPKPSPILMFMEGNKEWSIILPLSNNPKEILQQLEAIALNSEDQGTFEVILIEPVNISKTVSEILDSLKGDVTRIITQPGLSLPDMMNKASKIATGKTLLFLDISLLPLPKWLYSLKKGINAYGKNRILGAKIINKQKSILHAGIVLDQNHTPISAYEYLPGDFPSAMKERAFKMLDHFICINKTFFHKIGGFWGKTGKFAFMDICLRADTHNNDKDNCIYIPDACMMSLDEHGEVFSPEDSIYFFGKWQGFLWEDQEKLYEMDKMTKADLNTARIAQSMETTGLIG
jgi:hypothetical protein